MEKQECARYIIFPVPSLPLPLNTLFKVKFGSFLFFSPTETTGHAVRYRKAIQWSQTRIQVLSCATRQGTFDELESLGFLRSSQPCKDEARRCVRHLASNRSWVPANPCSVTTGVGTCLSIITCGGNEHGFGVCICVPGVVV